jgi:hypothetical protein
MGLLFFLAERPAEPQPRTAAPPRPGSPRR